MSSGCISSHISSVHVSFFLILSSRCSHSGSTHSHNPFTLSQHGGSGGSVGTGSVVVARTGVVVGEADDVDDGVVVVVVVGSVSMLT